MSEGYNQLKIIIILLFLAQLIMVIELSGVQFGLKSYA